MSHTIRIKDEVYSLLNDQANEAGVTPDVWVERKVKEGSKRRKVSGRKKREAWENFIGAIDSAHTSQKGDGEKARPLPDRVKESFGNAVDEKMKRAGLKLHK